MRHDTALTSGWRLSLADAYGAPVPDVAPLDISVPVGVHETLLAAGRIADPGFSDNARRATWVGECDWLFATAFDVPPLQPGQRVRLLFGGIDTLGEVSVNGQCVLSTDNMFREYAVDITEAVSSAGSNRLEVRIKSPVRYLQQVVMPEGFRDLTPIGHFLRKSSGDNGPYLGARPNFMKVGLWRPVHLSITEASWLDFIRVRASLSGNGGTLRLEAETGGAAAAAIRWRIAGPDGRILKQVEAAADAQVQIDIDQPELWWPWTHGAQPLYRASAELLDADGEVIDSKESNFAFRTIELMPSTADRKRFGFIVNGQPIFMRGGNWVPLTGITHVWNAERAKANLDFAQRANMNTLRVWGGGVVSDESFYDECDRRGLLVWQDFMFEYGLYPTRVWSKAFDETVAAEVTDIVKRLRNHPSIFLWCGGNEVEMSWDFQHGGHPGRGFDLFEQTMGPLCDAADGTRPYHVNSPIGGPVPNWPLEGDWHDYDFNTFSTGTSVPLFTSESGQASTPTFASMQKFLPPDELWPAGHDPRIARPGRPAWPPAWGYHAPDNSWDEIATYHHLIEPTTAWDLVRNIGVAHGEYIGRRYERTRRGIPDGQTAENGVPVDRRGWGVISWRLNDPWPVVQFSVVDSYLQPKIAYYYLKRAFAPVLLSFEPAADELGVWITNDGPEATTGELLVRRHRLNGTLLREHSQHVEVAAGQSVRCFDAGTLGPIFLTQDYVSATFNGIERTWLFSSERYLHLNPAKLDCRLDGKSLVLKADTFVRQLAIEPRGRTLLMPDENWFDLAADTERLISFSGEGRGEFRISGLNLAPLDVSLPR